MPNHVKNLVQGPAELVERLVGVASDGKPCVDFNRVIPMPEIIKGDCVPADVEGAAEIALGLIDFSALEVDALAAFNRNDYAESSRPVHAGNLLRQLKEGPHPKDFDDERFELFIRYLRAYRECGGLMNWYDWSCAMWGTKWNAYDFERESETKIVFSTAWSAPHPVMERLAEVAKASFIHEWADEDTGSNVGIRVYQADGTWTEQELSGTKEGYELAFSFRPEIEEYYEFDGVAYRYKEK